jgi:hypothetical protein
MIDRNKRPPTVWLTQSLLIIFALLLLSVLLLDLTMLLSRMRAGEDLPLVGAVIGFLIILGFALLLLIAFWGLAKRKRYGKWLGVLSLIFLWALILFAQVYRPKGRLQYYKYDSPAQWVGGVIVRVFISGLFLVLISRLAFGKRVKEFFRDEIEEAPMA